MIPRPSVRALAPAVPLLAALSTAAAVERALASSELEATARATDSPPWVARDAAESEPGGEIEERDEDEVENDDNGADAEDEESERRTPLAHLGIGLDADLEATSEHQAGKREGGVTFDEVGIVVDREWIEAEVSTVIDTEGGTEIVVENAWVALFGPDAFPVHVSAGRTVLPFGRYESEFVEDPLTVIVGETDDASLTLGVRLAGWDVSVGGFTGEHAGDGDVDWVLSVERSTGSWSAHASWTSDISESTDLREILRDRSDDGEPRIATAVPGLSIASTVDVGACTAYAEIVQSLDSFPAGTLFTRSRAPGAWMAEVGVPLARRWTVSFRSEGARELPGSPELQLGVSACVEITPWVSATLDAHRGWYPDLDVRHLLAFALSFSL